MHAVRRSFIAAALAAFVALAGPPAGAADFPAHALRVIVGTVPGGITDLGIRKLAEMVRQDLGQPVVVENKPGAQGTIAISQMIKSPADGYTLATVSTSSVLIAPLTTDVPFDPLKDVAYIMNYAGPSQALLVRADSKYRTLEQLVADARAHPGAIAYATFGVADAGGFGIKALSKAKGVTFNQIPYQGSAQQLMALLSGEVQFTVTSNYMSDINNKRLRALAVLDGQRYAGLPDTPTFKESGVDFDFPWIMGLVAPAGVPADIRRKLEAAFVKAARSPEFAQFMAQRDVPAYVMTADEMTRDMHKRVVEYTKAVKEYGFRQ
ncbi:tripartite tricarboxylate transporter substrate binding protein [Pigmentiphaga soli]|uniref:Tripartite tricarboxylate transporter substrate binding protein n=1 Tax=Pigmentiphaga soli TaxID=1007095 RepID=A0ABP8H1F7_9BURK